jgi:hypothetical protein
VSHRRPLVALAISAVLALALLPPEHVHSAEPHDGHHANVVHRHFEPHHRSEAQPSVDHADDDHDVQWLTTSFTSSRTVTRIGVDSEVGGQTAATLHPPSTRRAILPTLFVSVHDPPWATACGLRAPPPLSSDLI